MTAPTRLDVLPDALRLLRESRGLSQRRVGEAVGVKGSVVGGWERGERLPTLDRFVALADFYDLDLGDFEDALELAGAWPRRRRREPRLATDPRRLAQHLLGDQCDPSAEDRLTRLLESLFDLVRRLRD